MADWFILSDGDHVNLDLVRMTATQEDGSLHLVFWWGHKHEDADQYLVLQDKADVPRLRRHLDAAAGVVPDRVIIGGEEVECEAAEIMAESDMLAQKALAALDCEEEAT